MQVFQPWNYQLSQFFYSIRRIPFRGRSFHTGVRIWDELVDPHGGKIELNTIRPGTLTWYACGPTVYDSAHIGHASSYIRLDIIRRILESQGITVLQVMGVTDIDDKIIARSQLQNLPWTHLSQKYELEFFQELQQLNVKMPHLRARVTQYVPQIVNFISQLLSTSAAYSTPDGTVYFNTSKFPDYGKFREARTAENSTGSLEEGEAKRSSAKRNLRDFALWKGAKPGEPYWETPWGKGRPGWHIECSVIASHFFGEELDIHSGGMDLTFPHHENEEAQCCAYYGKHRWVRHWIHTGHLHLTGNVKMSKSIGNTVAIKEFLTTKSPDVLRMLCLMKRYNTNIDYNSETELHAVSLLRRLRTFISDCKAILLGTKKIRFKDQELWIKVISAKAATREALLNNFDTPVALLTIMELIGEFNRNTETEIDGSKLSNGVDFGLILAVLTTVQEFFDLVGVEMEQKQGSGEDYRQQLLEFVLTNSVDFRRKVRDFSLASDECNKAVRKEKRMERSSLMLACDEFRENLGSVGIDLADHGKDSSWAIKEPLNTENNNEFSHKYIK